MARVTHRVRVAIVDDEHLLRSGLRLVLEGCEALEVVGEAGDGAAAVELVRRDRPDVVLMDIRMPRMDGIEATRRVAGDAAVVMLTAFDTDDFILDALDAGAAGFLLKDTPPAAIIDAVLAAADGDLRFSSTVLSRLVGLAGRSRRAGRAEATAQLARLTGRERDVALAVAEGLTNAEIARALHLSLPTVKTHLGRVFDKLALSNRVQVALLVRDAELDG